MTLGLKIDITGTSLYISDPKLAPWRRGGLVVERWTPEREVGFDPHSGRRVVSLSKIHLPLQKVLVIPRKQWLHPNMTEKLLTGM